MTSKSSRGGSRKFWFVSRKEPEPNLALDTTKQIFPLQREPTHRRQAERLQDPSAATCLSAQAFNSLKSPPKARRFSSSYIIEHFMISLVSRSPAAALYSQLR